MNTFSPKNSFIVMVLAWILITQLSMLMESATINPNVVVAQDGTGNFKTVAEAVASVPANGKTRFTIYVKRGTYKENVEIAANKTNLMLIGDGMDATVITGSLNSKEGASIYNSWTVGVYANGFIAKDICFQNTAGAEKGPAVALFMHCEYCVIYRCRIDAFQDGLFAESGKQFYRQSVITGTVDFICGDAKAVFQKCRIVARKPSKEQGSNVITAESRSVYDHDSGFSFQRCALIPSEDLKPVMGSVKTFLGRPWFNFSRTVVMHSFLDSHIDPAGWTEWSPDTKSYLQTLYYGEYMNTGPGANTSNRVKWSGYHAAMTQDEANNFTVSKFLFTNGYDWLKDTGVPYTSGLF